MHGVAGWLEELVGTVFKTQRPQVQSVLVAQT